MFNSFSENDYNTPRSAAQITLTAEELAKVINDTKGELSDLEEDGEEGGGGGANHDEDDDDDENDESMDVSDSEQPQRSNNRSANARRPVNPDDEYNFDDYDNEGERFWCGEAQELA